MNDPQHTFSEMLDRLNRWLAASALRAYEKLMREQIEQNRREREAVRDYFDKHYPSPTGRGWTSRG